jgi:hypothetical protein
MVKLNPCRLKKNVTEFLICSETDLRMPKAKANKPAFPSQGLNVKVCPDCSEA